MKNLTLFSSLFIVILSLLAGCTRENVDYHGTSKETITQSQWSVDYYFEGHDKTSQFDNYKFSFLGNGTLTADDGAHSINGNWTMITDANRNSVLHITVPESTLQDLNDQWTINRGSGDHLIMKGLTSEMRLRKL